MQSFRAMKRPVRGASRVQLLSVCVIGIVAGCSWPLPIKYNTPAWQVANDIRSQQTSSGAILASVADAVAGPPPRGATFTENAIDWCSDIPDADKAVRAAKARFRELCAAKLGLFEDRICLGRGNIERILFFADVRASPCDGGKPKITVQVVEPTDDPAADAYLQRLSRAGYPNPQEAQLRAARLASQRAARQAAATQQINAEMARLDAELPAMHKRGTTVCRTERSVIYRGFIEDFTDEKIKINVAFAAMVNAPAMQAPGFQPQTIWDFPVNWRLC